MTVYIVTKGVYSDYHIEAVFTDKALAEEYVRRASEDGDDECSAEEWEENAINPRAEATYSIFMGKDGYGRSSYMTWDDATTDAPTISFGPWDHDGTLLVKAKARSLQHAMKIANEVRTQVLAADLWPAPTKDFASYSVNTHTGEVKELYRREGY
jgi:hypothetical protein